MNLFLKKYEIVKNKFNLLRFYLAAYENSISAIQSAYCSWRLHKYLIEFSTFKFPSNLLNYCSLFPPHRFMINKAILTEWTNHKGIDVCSTAHTLLRRLCHHRHCRPSHESRERACRKGESAGWTSSTPTPLSRWYGLQNNKGANFIGLSTDCVIKLLQLVFSPSSNPRGNT